MPGLFHRGGFNQSPLQLRCAPNRFGDERPVGEATGGRCLSLGYPGLRGFAHPWTAAPAALGGRESETAPRATTGVAGVADATDADTGLNFLAPLCKFLMGGECRLTTTTTTLPGFLLNLCR